MLMNLENLYPHVRGVLHIGAHHGQEVRQYIDSGIKNIALFEPVPEHVEKITEDFRDDDITLYQVALGSEEKTMQMNVSDFEGQNAELYKGMSTSLLKPSIHLEQYPHIKFNESIEVEVTTLDILAEEDEIVPEDFNFMNIDVQGYELEVMKGASKFLPHIQFIYCEVNRAEVYEGCPMVEEIDQFLSEYNFERVDTNWAGDTWGDALYIKRKTQ